MSIPATAISMSDRADLILDYLESSLVTPSIDKMFLAVLQNDSEEGKSFTVSSEVTCIERVPSALHLGRDAARVQFIDGSALVYEIYEYLGVTLLWKSIP